MTQLQDFIFEKLPPILAGGIGGGGLLILIQYFVPGYKQNITSQRDVLRYINIELKKRDKIIESQGEKIKVQSQEIKSQAKEILEIKFRYQLSQEQMETLKEYIAKDPEAVNFLNKVEKKYTEKEMFLNEITGIDSGNKSLTKYNLTVILSIVFLIVIFFTIFLSFLFFTAYREQDLDRMKIEKSSYIQN